MKKLLIAMTAAAVGTCAWAEESAPTLLSEGFDSWALHLDEVNNVMTNQWWSYNADAVGDGELTLADGKLSLNTGSKKLTGDFVSDKSSTNIPADNLYFNAKVKFQDPSDTLPDMTDSDKFAIVALDNIESLTEAQADDPKWRATNLWVIAGFGTSQGVKRAYKLALNGGATVNLDSSFFGVEKQIIVKAYNKAIKDTARAGFLVMVGGNTKASICTVVQSCAITDGKIDYSTAIDGTSGDITVVESAYLGVVKGDIVDDLQERYSNRQLIIANGFGDTLTSVDFQGQGTIDEVSLATTGADFGDDVTVKKLTFTGLNGITGITSTVLTGEEYTFTIPNDAIQNTKYEFTVTVDAGYVLTGNGVTAGADANTYKYTYTYNGAASDSVTLNAFQPVAKIGGTFVSADDFADTLAGAGFASGSTIELMMNVTIDGAININEGDTLTINLNGKTISPVQDNGLVIINFGTLVVVDETASGKIDGAIIGSGTFDLRAGQYKNVGYPVADPNGGAAWPFPTLNNGFKADLNAGNTYYVVTVAGGYTESDDLVADATEEQKAAVTEQLGAIDEALKALNDPNVATGDAGVKAYIQAAYGEGNPVPVATLLDAKNIGISVANNLPLMTSENAEFVAEAVAADDGNVAAFEFTLKDGNTDDAETLRLSAQTAIQKLIKVCSDLKNNSWTAPTIGTDVDATVTDGKIKVQLKSGKANFMKIQATAK